VIERFTVPYNNKKSAEKNSADFFVQVPQHTRKQIPKRVSGIFGTIVLIGLD
jgi:hypothetical protein